MVNYWTEKRGFAKAGVEGHLQQSVRKAQRSMSGMNLTVSVFGTEPWIAYRGMTITGVEVKMLDIVAKGLNFTYHFKREYAYLVENATAHAMTGIFGSVSAL